MRRTVRIVQNIKLLLFSLLVRPVSLLIKKDPELVAFMPRDGHRYTDNVVHLFESLRLDGMLPQGAYLLVEGRPDVSARWREKARPAFDYEPFNWRQAIRYLRTSAVITDNWQWSLGGRIAFFSGARKVQIWHGIPLKKVELGNLAGARRRRGVDALLQKGLQWLKGRYPVYDLVVTTSAFAEQRMRGSFRSSRFIRGGYPRNDYFYREDRGAIEVERDVAALEKLRVAKSRGDSIVLYAPTFRDFGGDAFEEGILDGACLQEFAESVGLMLVIKFHPYVKAHHFSEELDRIVIYEASADAAPLLQEVDLLIADYSSIYFDFLHVDRPILFFPYDKKRYLKRDRELSAPYEDMTPGRTVTTMAQLLAAIVEELEGEGPCYAQRREELRKLLFGERRGPSSAELWSEIRSLSSPR